jgi:hypothetical protein
MSESSLSSVAMFFWFSSLLNSRDHSVVLRGAPSLQLFLRAVESECNIADGRVSIEGFDEIVDAFFATLARDDMERVGWIKVLLPPHAGIEADQRPEAQIRQFHFVGLPQKCGIRL